MEIKLTKRPRSPIILEGFPGFGLVGTITTEFLIDHLKTEEIGHVWFKELPAMIAIHENRIVKPIGIFYSKKYNMVIFHVVTAQQGIEWKISEAILKVSKMLRAKEIISIEGVGQTEERKKGEIRTFFYTSDHKKKKALENIGIKPLEEGIIIGPTASVISQGNLLPTAFFAETKSNLPDSSAAAEIIKDIDKYLGLNIDPKPLLEQAVQFEEKLKGIISKQTTAQELAERKKLSYVG